MTDSAAQHRILVVDDEPNIVDVICMALRYQGLAVESAATGAAAISAVADFKPDLIVLDVMLPDMEGFDVAERLGAQRARVPLAGRERGPGGAGLGLAIVDAHAGQVATANAPGGGASFVVTLPAA